MSMVAKGAIDVAKGAINFAKGAVDAAGTAPATDIEERTKKRGMPELHPPSQRIEVVINNWLKEHRRSGNRTSEFEWSTPDLEFENAILHRNIEHNRKLREPNLDSMVRHLTRGNDFLDDTAPICLNLLGNLEAGQHRCVASIRARVPSRHIVKIGPVGFARRNRSQPDSVADVWRREKVDHKYLPARAGIIRLLLSIRDNRRPRTNEEDRILEISKEFNGMPEFEQSILYCYRTSRPFSSQIMLGTAYFLIVSTGNPAGAGFMEELWVGTNRTSRKKNINGLRAYLARLDQLNKAKDPSFRSGYTQNFRALNAIILSWNAYPSAPHTYSWEGETLISGIRK
jgi:hypothetical protein